MASLIRIGRVSSVDAANGYIQVTYADRGGATTASMPYFAFNDEYKMPQKEQMVIVLHLENGSAAGIVMGSFWNQKNMPAESGEGLFLKQLGSTAGEAYIKAQGGAVEIYGSAVTITGGSSLTVDEIAETLKDHEERIAALGG